MSARSGSSKGHSHDKSTMDLLAEAQREKRFYDLKKSGLTARQI